MCTNLDDSFQNNAFQIITWIAYVMNLQEE